MTEADKTTRDLWAEAARHADEYERARHDRSINPLKLGRIGHLQQLWVNAARAAEACNAG